MVVTPLFLTNARQEPQVRAVPLPRPASASSCGLGELAWGPGTSADSVVVDEAEEDDMTCPGGRSDLSAQSAVP